MTEARRLAQICTGFQGGKLWSGRSLICVHGADLVSKTSGLLHRWDERVSGTSTWRQSGLFIPTRTLGGRFWGVVLLSVHAARTYRFPIRQHGLELRRRRADVAEICTRFKVIQANHSRPADVHDSDHFSVSVVSIVLPCVHGAGWMPLACCPRALTAASSIPMADVKYHQHGQKVLRARLRRAPGARFLNGRARAQSNKIHHGPHSSSIDSIIPPMDYTRCETEF
ncbi:hypothetical protein C8R46DRAFT_1068118 [Mycena filopes]|nr:hypothetical protein C8R46DRAFT_1068118 [Mycena filopes]